MAIDLFGQAAPVTAPQSPMAAPQYQAPGLFQALAPAAIGLLGTALGGGNTFARGYAGGLNNASRNRRAEYDQQLRRWRMEQAARQSQAQMDLSRERLDELRAGREQTAADIARLSGGDAGMAALLRVDPGAAMDQLFPQAPKLPGSVQEAQWLLTATPEERAAFEAAQRAGAAVTNINMPGQPSFTPMSDEMKVSLGIPVGEQGWYVDGNGNPKRVAQPGVEETRGVLAAEAGKRVEATLSELEKDPEVREELTSAMRAVKEMALPSSLENFVTSAKGQQYINAARETAARDLGYSSGAAVPDYEFLRWMETYTMRPGDDPETIKSKGDARRSRLKEIDRRAVNVQGFQGTQRGPVTVEALEDALGLK